MVAQTSVDRNNGADNSPSQAVARNTGELLSDALTLIELQSKLLLLDVQSDLRKLITPIALVLTGALLAFACLPIALTTLALGLAAGTGMELWAAFAISLAAGLVIAVALLGAGVWFLLHGLSFIAHSRVEWDQNVRWFKSLLRRLGDRPRQPTQPGLF
ncbi:MAG TPA: phage holin family protein [Pirellulaceae bacterium]|nr:phage holin family protein [Pirellulaceae bacterium]